MPSLLYAPPMAHLQLQLKILRGPRRPLEALGDPSTVYRTLPPNPPKTSGVWMCLEGWIEVGIVGVSPKIIQVTILICKGMVWGIPRFRKPPYCVYYV